MRERATDELSERDLASLRALFDASWADGEDAYTGEDFANARGGVHFTIEEDATLVSHASVVRRVLETNGLRLTTGYVEAVSTLPSYRRRGYATAIMERVGAYIDRTFELGALETGIQPFYRRLGWTEWKGPTSVRTDAGPVPTSDEDGYVMVRLTPSSPSLDLSAPISCDWRPGDVW